MSSTFSPGEILSRLTRELEHTATRSRNGLRHLRGETVGRIDSTPRDLVWERGKARLWRYRSDTIARHPPLLLFMGLVNRPYIFDLLPDNSFARRLGDAGFDVYLLDWGVADELEADNSLETYVLRYLPRAIDAARRTAGSDAVTLVPYCMGVVFALLLMATRQDLPVRAMVTLAAPVDFARLGSMVEPLQDGSVQIDALIGEDGLVAADVLRSFAQVRRPTGDAVHYATLWEKLASDEQLEGYVAMAQVAREHVPMPGALCRQMVEMFVLGNGFVEGTARIGDRRVSLRDVRIPVLSVLAERDALVPNAASLPLGELIGADRVTVTMIPAGHAGIIVGRVAAQHSLPRIVEWLAAHSDEHPGGVVR